jgi:O-acetyl-ADP-ribose deacetylase (regulator of RNase III)
MTAKEKVILALDGHHRMEPNDVEYNFADILRHDDVLQPVLEMEVDTMDFLMIYANLQAMWHPSAVGRGIQQYMKLAVNSEKEFKIMHAAQKVFLHSMLLELRATLQPLSLSTPTPSDDDDKDSELVSEILYLDHQEDISTVHDDGFDHHPFAVLRSESDAISEVSNVSGSVEEFAPVLDNAEASDDENSDGTPYNVRHAVYETEAGLYELEASDEEHEAEDVQIPLAQNQLVPRRVQPWRRCRGIQVVGLLCLFYPVPHHANTMNSAIPEKPIFLTMKEFFAMVLLTTAIALWFIPKLCRVITAQFFGKTIEVAPQMPAKSPRILLRKHRGPPPPPFRNIFEEVFAKTPSDNHLDRMVSYQLAGDKILTVVHGSICDFPGGWGAIVNAANKYCLEGSGVDSAISEAGGEQLEEARGSMSPDPDGVRCPPGSIKLLGPRTFGALRVPYVIMAVGPNYKEISEDEEDPLATVQNFDNLLRDVYMKCCTTASQHSIKQMAFPLISTGAFRGKQSSKRLIKLSLETLYLWSQMEEAKKSSLNDIVIVAYTWKEAKKVISACDEVFNGHLKALLHCSSSSQPQTH